MGGVTGTQRAGGGSQVSEAHTKGHELEEKIVLSLNTTSCSSSVVECLSNTRPWAPAPALNKQTSKHTHTNPLRPHSYVYV